MITRAQIQADDHFVGVTDMIGEMITRAQIQDLEEWLTDQPDVKLTYRINSFGFWYGAFLNGRHIHGGVTERDETTPLLAIQRHVEAVRRNPGIGNAEPWDGTTRTYGPEGEAE